MKPVQIAGVRSLAFALALALALVAPRASALTVAEVTRHGYILVDEPGAAHPYYGTAGAGVMPDFISFLSDATATLDRAGAPHGDFVAVMQQDYEPAVLSFYLRIRNETLGVGDSDPQGSRSETYDLNFTYGTAFPLEGALFLNTTGFYINANSAYGVQVICPQEFAHRFLAQLLVPRTPTTASDAGDAGPQPSDILLGRGLVHWSYFMNTGGSPMEGNAWTEVSPGVFQTGAPSYVFSPLDLYAMGLTPAQSVSPFWVIANPDVMGQLDGQGNLINRASPPEGFGFPARMIQVTGARVTYSIEDVVLANGSRDPPYALPMPARRTSFPTIHQ